MIRLSMVKGLQGNPRTTPGIMDNFKCRITNFMYVPKVVCFHYLIHHDHEPVNLCNFSAT